LPTTLTFQLRKITNKTVLGNLVLENLNSDIGSSFTADASIKLVNPNIKSSFEFRAKIDTGAYLTLLPPRAFKEIKPTNFINYSLYGVNKTPKCAIECAITKINIILKDSFGNISPILDIWTALSINEDIPPLLGMRGILDTYKHIWDPISSNVKLFFP